MIIVVSGLPRSGTSMMMQMLEAGGVPVVVDGDNSSTDINPGGRYEAHITLRRISEQRYEVLEDGKAIKVSAYFIDKLPRDRQYKIIYMERDKTEVAISWRKMMKDLGREQRTDTLEQETDAMKSHDAAVKKWLAKQPAMDVLLVNYNGLVSDPLDSCKDISEFLGLPLDIEAMTKVPDARYYRSRT